MVDFCESYSPFHVCLTTRPSAHLVYATSLLSHFIHIWYLGWPWSEHAHIIPISRMVDFCESCSPFHVCLTICPSPHLVYAVIALSMFFIPPLPGGGGGYTVLPLSVQDIFRRIFLSNYRWQKSDVWSQASYRYAILWVAFLDPSDSYFLFADLVGFYTHWTYMHIFCRIFLSKYWWQKSDISSQASYRYPILWEAFFDPSDSYFLFADLVGFYTHLTYMHIFRRIFLSNYWWQESDIWSQASYRYPISW
jgi:hypothetical protein